MSDSEKLAVIMPVYNEEGAISSVLEKWVNKFDSMCIDYLINVYNDGSKDNTAEILAQSSQKFIGKVRVCNKLNSGHGPTILQGYNDATNAGYTWVFQIDSDDEMGPEKFDKLWEQREKYDFLVGVRDGRKQLFSRKVISFISRLCVRVFFGKSIWDVNTPYRLMRVSLFSDIFRNIPLDTFAPNVIISGMAARKKMHCFEIPIPQRNRQTGEVSIKKWKLFRVAIKSFRQTICFAFFKRF